VPAGEKPTYPRWEGGEVQQDDDCGAMLGIPGQPHGRGRPARRWLFAVLALAVFAVLCGVYLLLSRL
jgi:hypothetical protein